MHLYNYTLQPSSAIVQAAVGNFSGLRQQEILVSNGTRLELLQVDNDSGKLSTVAGADVFGSIRSLAAFRLTGGSKDYAIVGSDSGRIVILEYDPKTNVFNKLHQETYGKSGTRRIVPGQYLATDPRGRSVMIAAMENSKLVYVLNRDVATNLTISSPLGAHRASTIVHDVVGVDVGFDNPVRAEKLLTYYELDLGLNHVVRKWSEPTDPRANLLVQVPGGQSTNGATHDGPSGVLVCCENHIIYQHGDAPSHRVPIPRRQDPVADPNQDVIIVAAVMHKMKGSFFFLLQTEDGDVFKATVDHEDGVVSSLKIKYFETVPVASNLCILKQGLLFVASEFGNHHLYRFCKLGDDDDQPEFSSSSYPSYGMAEPEQPLPRASFDPRPMENLMLIDELSSLNPVLDAKILKPSLDSEAPKIFAACGRGPASSFKILSHGLEVDEMASSELPGFLAPHSLWSTKRMQTDHYDNLLVMSFQNATIVLSIGESMEEVKDSGFLTSMPTLAVQQIGENGLIQVHTHGIRHLVDSQVNEWKVPQGQTIVAANTNRRQVVVALSSAEIVYFELDQEGQLNEYQDMKAMGSTVLALGLGEVPEGRLRFPYLAVGCEDQTVRVMSLDPDSTLETISLQALTAPPSSICIAYMLDASINKVQRSMFVNIGLANGVLLRTVLDGTNGQLTDTRTRFLGTKPVRLLRVKLKGEDAILAISSRVWLNYSHQQKMEFTPLACETPECASSFTGESCPEGIISIAKNTLSISTVSKLGMKLKQESVPLAFTPRKFVTHPGNRFFYLIESDQRTLSEEEEKKKLADLNISRDDHPILQLPAKIFGRTRASAGHWASRIHIFDPMEAKTVATLPLKANEAAFSIAVVPFASTGGEYHLVVGTAMHHLVTPPQASASYLKVYKIVNEGTGLELLHETPIQDSELPRALLAFQGRLLAGVGKALRIYDLGKKKLLRKAETKSPTAIVSLATQGSRIVIGDMQESTLFAVYKEAENRLLIFGDDTQPRWVSAMTMVDYNTVAVGDKFGNIFVNRLDSTISDQVDEDPTGAGILHEKATLNGAPHKTKMLAHFHVGDIITSIHKVSLVVGGREVLLYTGLQGTIGILVPLTSKEDIEFLTMLEQHIRNEQGSLVGRDHLSWRGYYVPVKAVIDGDLCETYGGLSSSKQSAIASELDRTVGDVLKKLDQMRVASSGF
ncbi:pre-mRNA-splicing factor rse1 [Coprinopsis cinerea AmutBmut pab1-1]|nr:pre-mRNA-splicing factor rse1 [Coprinopsis cinerea AmutBmut pab1-1]